MDLVVDSVSKIVLNDQNLFQLEELEIKYKDYIKKILELETKKLKYYLTHIKNKEIVANQETESEERFLIELYYMAQKKNSIDLVMEILKKEEITKCDIVKIHKMVIKGSSDDLSKNYKFRSDNDKWVGNISISGERDIDYIPPDYNNMSTYLEFILKYLNDKNVEDFNEIFIKPFIMHALTAYIQPFGNGNTRLARVLQHGKICELTNEFFQINFATPCLYLSKNYLNTRRQYRKLISRIVQEKSNVAWNDWFTYNLYMVEEQLYFLNNQVNKYSRN